MIEKRYNSKNDEFNINDSNVGWNASNLFYIFLNVLDMDYMSAYYINDWDRMLKVFKLKYMKVNVFIDKKATEKEKLILDEEEEINKLTDLFKESSTDFGMKHNNMVVKQIINIIEIKMALLDRLMSKAGMNIYLEKTFAYKPSALGQDDF